MTHQLDELIESLLYEGYALYPYTPGATKNATPDSVWHRVPHLPMPSEVVQPSITFRWTASRGETRRGGGRLRGISSVRRFETRSGQATRADIAGSTLERPRPSRMEMGIEFVGLNGRIELSAIRQEVGSWRVRVSVENSTAVDEHELAGIDRAGALQRSFISTHPVARLRGGRFVSPLEAKGCENVNTWPVLATDEDDAMVGAAIMLPDHPAIAPQSKGNLFDGTEIEEALLLHVQALSDDERSSITVGDPAVLEMVDRAMSVAPEDIFNLHSTMRPAPKDPAGSPPFERGEKEVVVDGRTVRPGAKLALRLGDRTDVYDKMLDGRIATLQRIYLD